ncbi:enolase C-terminal domain-like protein [Devosia salina]|uniref:Mandelate racemase n=1 Tax=Devosia salina TaxID=2860336 RepID=A0ABX8WC13_9HYPH|nr:enolase C-terminal domain-like protein [Devosia salina]QYO75634.1 mandelate racemase [Devosia salina]
MSAPRLKALKVRVVLAPLRRPLVNASGSLPRVPLVLVDMETDAGITGIAYLFSPSPLVLRPLAALLEEIGSFLAGQPVEPVELERKLQKSFLLLGGTGLVTMALAAVDMAAWDIVGKLNDKPLAELWGGSLQPLRAYNSLGLGLMGSARAAVEAVELLEFGFTAIKLRLGYPTLAEDVAVTRAVRAAVGPEIEIVADFNQCLELPEAMRRCQALDGEGLAWIEEAIRADDYAGSAALARQIATPVQIGENFWSVGDVAKAVAAGASDLIMPDVMKIGGMTPWLRAAGLASGHGVPVSSHLFPEASQHLLAAASTRHYLEYVDWAGPVLQEPLRIENGHSVVDRRPGHGMAWNEDAIGALLL